MRSGAELPSRPGIALSVVVPCYDEEEGNGEFYTRVMNVCRDQAAQSHGIVLVNDGSKDATRDQIFRLSQRDRHVVAINLARNYGHEIALSAALPRRPGGRATGAYAALVAPASAHLGRHYAIDTSAGSGRRRAVWIGIGRALSLMTPASAPPRVLRLWQEPERI